MNSVKAKLRDLFLDPTMKNIDIESQDRIDAHRNIMLNKPILLGVFKDFYELYNKYNNEVFSNAEGKKIELGAGSSIIKKFYPEVITTDVIANKHLDKTLDSQNMNLSNNSVKSILGINCFHHFAKPRKFFSELDRVLSPGGGCVLIEPYYGPFSNIIHSMIHNDEHFNKKQKLWESDAQILTDANQALSYLIFKRDRKIFEQEFPNLEIVEIRKLPSYLRYLLSGGVNFKQLIPSKCEIIIKFIERITTPLHHLLSLHYAICIRKKN